MKCDDDDKMMPLDKLMDQKTKEFESGSDRECDKDLDAMIWRLGDFETEEPPQDAGEFGEELPAEEELIETRIAGPERKGRRH